jgi:hypothetical protein
MTNCRARPHTPRNSAAGRQAANPDEFRGRELAKNALATPYDIAVMEAGCIPWS